MRAADHVIKMGPGAGIHGGEVVVQGTLETLLAHPTSLTGQFLKQHLQVVSGARQQIGDADGLIRAGERRD